MTNRSLYTLAFIEGLAVMAVELLGSKMLTPFFGSSLYIWTSIIGVTLLSLTLGYYIGGRLSKKENRLSNLYLLFIGAAVAGLAMPFIANITHQKLIHLNLFASCILMSALILTLPLILLGATSPLIIQIGVKDLHTSGTLAGNIYGISTIGAIISTFSLGFFLIPHLGIRIPLTVCCFMILIVTNILLPFNRKIILYTLLPITFFMYHIFKTNTPKGDHINVVYHSEGLMGQLKVVDYKNKNGYIERALLTNNGAQSIITKDNVTVISQFNYVHFISTLSSLKPAGSNVLLLGMAGGSLVYELQKLHFHIDVVDIDSRMFDVAERFFYLQKEDVTLYTDDARHFIKTAKKKYDIVIIDISSSETQPSYLYTQECFSEIKKILQPQGFFFINFQGSLNDSSKLTFATLSVFNTLNTSGFRPYYYTFEKGKSDVQFIASPSSIDFSGIDPAKINLCCLQNIHIKKLIKDFRVDSVMPPNKSKPLILTDNLPKLEQLKSKAVASSRKEIIENLDEKKNKFSFDLFK